MENNNIIAELRHSLTQNFEAQKNLLGAQHQTIQLFRKILRRLTFIFICLSLSIVMWFFVITHFINVRVSANTAALKNINELNKNVLLQRRFNEMDRIDISNARKELAPVLRMIDSTKHVQDSIWKRQIKREMK